MQYTEEDYILLNYYV